MNLGIFQSTCISHIGYFLFVELGSFDHDYLDTFKGVLLVPVGRH